MELPEAVILSVNCELNQIIVHYPFKWNSNVCFLHVGETFALCRYRKTTTNAPSYAQEYKKNTGNDENRIKRNIEQRHNLILWIHLTRSCEKKAISIQENNNWRKSTIWTMINWLYIMRCISLRIKTVYLVFLFLRKSRNAKLFFPVQLETTIAILKTRNR